MENPSSMSIKTHETGLKLSLVCAAMITAAKIHLALGDVPAAETQRNRAIQCDPGSPVGRP